MDMVYMHVSRYVVTVIIYSRECNQLSTFCFLSYLESFCHLEHAGASRKINPKDVAKLGGSSLILGCRLKEIDTIGEGIHNLKLHCKVH